MLFSASQRANKGRRRHKHDGSTASIYMSEKLGGKQIGTLVQTIATSDGAIILDSVPDQKMNTLGPLFLKTFLIQLLSSLTVPIHGLDQFMRIIEW